MRQPGGQVPGLFHPLMAIGLKKVTVRSLAVQSGTAPTSIGG